jgi:hypothetical protein
MMGRRWGGGRRRPVRRCPFGIEKAEAAAWFGLGFRRERRRDGGPLIREAIPRCWLGMLRSLACRFLIGIETRKPFHTFLHRERL